MRLGVVRDSMILINPVAPNRMGMISRYSPITLPMGVGTLTGCLLSKGKQVKIVDELISPIDRCLDDIDDTLKQFNKPYIFGISCLTINIGRGLEIARLLKAKYPDSKVILGGIHPTALPEETLNAGGVDIVLRGEGEETLPLLYDAIKNGQSYSDIEGISFKEDNKTIHNPSHPLIKNLNAIPRFPYELFDVNKYNLGFVITSRGCPHNCIFCSQGLILGRKYRFRLAEAVIEEIDLLINRYHQQSIGFFDDDLLANRERVELLCESIIQNGFNAKAEFSCQTRADNVDQEMLSVLKDAGFTSLGLGMETGSERLMKLLNKGETVRDNIEAVKLIKRMGFRISGFFLFGLPSETNKERFETYQLAKQLKLDYAKFNNIVPYPGTRLLEIARKEGSLTISENWENFNSVEGIVGGVFSKSKLPYVPINTTEKQLKRDLVRANFYFYLAHLSALFAPGKANPGWFLLPKRWYLKPKEYYHLIKLILKVMLNCIVVFDLGWFIKGVLRRIGWSRR